MISTNGAWRQPDCPPNPPRRRDLSWRYATDSDLVAISYTITLGRWKEIRDLKARALRVLRFFASLNRTGTAGYRGTRCSMGALAAAVGRATEEAASKRTVQRALKELVEAGYLTYTTANGRFRQIGPDNWIPEQICIYTLTDKALAIWSYTSPPMTKCRDDDRKNPENKSQIFARAKERVKLMEKNEKEIADKSVSILPVRQNISACVTPIDVTGSTKSEMPERIIVEGKQRSSGAKKGHAEGNAKKAILELLRMRLSKRGRQGKVALARAAMEISEGQIVGEAGTGIPWNYWIERWFKLTHEERYHVVHADVLPILLNPDKQARKMASAPDGNRSTPSTEPRKRQPTKEDTIRNLKSLESLWGSDLVAKIARRLAIDD